MICTTRVPERRGGLNDVGGDAAREVIGEIGHRLAQDIAVRLPADEIGHPRRNRLLDDEVAGETRQRTADEDQERHRQKLAAVSLKDAFRARRAQHIDQRADEAQNRHFDQRNDQADRHQRGEKGPDLTAITPIVADEARGRHARIVITKRIDAGFKETEHGLWSTGNHGRSRIRKRWRGRR
jgi:hypothetical protein